MDEQATHRPSVVQWRLACLHFLRLHACTQQWCVDRNSSRRTTGQPWGVVWSHMRRYICLERLKLAHGLQDIGLGTVEASHFMSHVALVWREGQLVTISQARAHPQQLHELANLPACVPRQHPARASVACLSRPSAVCEPERAHYSHEQTQGAATWTVHHTLSIFSLMSAFSWRRL